MASISHRSGNRIPDTDWVEVLSSSGERSLAVGHLKDVSEAGLSVELPVCLTPGTRVKVRLSSMASDVLHHHTITGLVVHTEASGEGCAHGIKFEPVTRSEALALTDYLCQVEYHHRVTP